jgi:hypothetical protein
MRALVFPEGHLWIAEALELDVVAQGSSVEDAIESLRRTIELHEHQATRGGVAPFADVERAPPVDLVDACERGWLRGSVPTAAGDCSVVLGRHPGARRRRGVVALCGSTRFYKEFMKANYDETMAGRIVLSVAFDPRARDDAHGETVGCTPEQKEMLDELHLRRIDIADEVLVLNVDGYVGESTRRELTYALAVRRTLRWLEPGNGQKYMNEHTRELEQMVDAWRRELRRPRGGWS